MRLFSVLGWAVVLRLASACLPAATLTWADGVVTAGNAQFERRWTLIDGLPSAVSIRNGGEEWLHPSHRATTVLPAGMTLCAPLVVRWDRRSGRANANEAISEQATLTVVGKDGKGYRWELKVFEASPSVTSQLSLIGWGGEGEREDAGLKPEELPASDLMEGWELQKSAAQLIVTDLADVTDRHDNLAAERVWRLSPTERIAAATTLCAVEDSLTGRGLIVLKHAPLPTARPGRSVVPDVVASDRSLQIRGLGMDSAAASYAWTVLGYSGGRWGRASALHRLQASLREFRPGRDGLLMSNTWGDRNRDSRINADFIRAEISADRSLGADLCQIDDGWQRGITANSAVRAGGAWGAGYWASDPAFWDPRPGRFPAGFQPVTVFAAQQGVGLGLWFSPDAAQEYRDWRRDADAVIGLYRRWHVTHVKIDGLNLETKRAERNFHAFAAAVINETQGKVALELDVTAGRRPGYFGLMEAGIFVENRYTDFHSWWPHATLRNLWQLSWSVAPQRLRMEFLNSDRNQAKYAGDLLAPSYYPAEYACATTLIANPLAWLEVSHLPAELARPIRRLIAIWKVQRGELQGGDVLPIGDTPSGAAWTGFCSVASSAQTAQILVFRELTPRDSADLPLPLIPGRWQVEQLAGEGRATISGAQLHVQIPASLHYLWIRAVKS